MYLNLSMVGAMRTKSTILSTVRWCVERDQTNDQTRRQACKSAYLCQV